jgi:hypothetical protein
MGKRRKFKIKIFVKSRKPFPASEPVKIHCHYYFVSKHLGLQVLQHRNKVSYVRSLVLNK